MTDDLDSRVNALESLVDSLRTKVREVESRAETAEVRVRTVEKENEELRAELDTLRDRTDLLDHVKEASALKPERRAAVLIATLHNQAQTNDGLAEMEVSEAQAALGGSVDRTLMYSTFEKAVELVGDEDVLCYIRESRASSANSRLKINLRKGELPDTIAGQSIKSREEAQA